tara:strand:- start:154 stop:498 length:345 start_codon:yes stop_codon:yes gene_type:complete
MNRRIIIICILISLLCLWFYRENNQEKDAQTDAEAAAEAAGDQLTGVVYEVAPIITSTLNTKQKIISFLTQAGFGIDVANNMYDSYKKDHPDRSDTQMFESMKEKINLKKRIEI